MTYSAPRQERFFVIVLLSFCLHIFAFTISVKQSHQIQEKQMAEHLSTQLANELAIPMTINNKVDMAVVINAHKANPFVSNITLFDNSDAVLIDINNIPSNHNTQDGITAGINHAGQALGKVVVKTKAINSAQAIGDHFAFVLEVLFLHATLWLIYGYIARPSNALINDLTNKARDDLLINGIIDDRTQSTPNNPTKTATDHTKSDTTQQPFQKMKKIAAQEDQPSAASETPPTNSTQTSDHAPKDDKLTATFCFVDEYNILPIVADDMLEGCYALYNDVLQKSIEKFLSQPRFKGIDIQISQEFDKTGAAVDFYRTNNNIRLAEAMALFMKLFLSVSDIIYQQSRTLNRVALPIKSIGFDTSRTQGAQRLLEKYNNAAMVLLSGQDVKEIITKMNVVVLQTNGKGSIHERECRVLGDLSNDTAQLLTKLLNDIFQKNS